MRLSKEEKDYRKEKRRQEKYDATHKLIEGKLFKLCSIHNDWVELNEMNFYRNDLNGIDGYYPYCKICSIVKTRKWRNDNQDQYKEYYTERNKELDINRKEEFREITRNRRKNGKYYDWLKENPDKTSVYRKKRKKKNHKITDLEWDACRLYFDYRCAYCEKTWEQNYKETKKDMHKEHFIDDGANDLSNCVPSCRDCNSYKWEFSFDEWYNEGNPIFSEARKAKIMKWITIDYKKFIDMKTQ